MLNKKIMMILSLFLLSGCGAMQTISDSTVDMTKSIFIRQIKELHLDLRARVEINTDDSEMPASVMIRTYQLSDNKVFNMVSYESLVNDDNHVLSSELLATHEVILKPGVSISLDLPFDKKANYVAVVALFRNPDLTNNTWKLVLGRNDLEVNTARLIIVNKNTLELIP